MWQQLLPGLRMMLVLTVLTGLIYPLAVTGLCQMLFRDQANGSLKTVNGQAYTDFEATALLPSTAQAGERNRNGKFVYKTNHTSSVRIGSGGPELSFETVNGDIRIKKESR